MRTLALRSLRHRPTASAATFLAALLGSALAGSFATLVETSTGPVSDADAEALVTMGAVVGGWGALIVLFSVVSTVGITVRQRAGEIGLLRTVGATPRQAGRLVRGEALVVTAIGAALGALLASLGGRALLALVRGHLVAGDVEYGGTWRAPVVTAAAVVLVGALAARLAARRATRGPARPTLAEAGDQTTRLKRWRVVLAVLMLGYATALAVVTMTVMADSDDPYAAMQTSGSLAILVALALALVAPVLLRLGAAALRPLLGATGAGHLAAWNTTRRAHLLAGVLGPVIVLSAAAVGVLMLVGVDGRTLDAASPLALDDEEAGTITLLNNVVVAMIVLFAAIMVVNAIAAVVADRRLELERLRLLGATPAQVRGSVVLESVVVAVVGVVAGGLASAATVVPFAVARGEGVVPDGQLWLPPLVLAAAAALTVGASRVAVGRVTRATRVAGGR